MRLLFEIDRKDYDNCTHIFQRDSARSIIIVNRKIAMIHSKKYDYYKFPGGGIEYGESPAAAMIRETREEVGLLVKPESIKEYGYVHRIQKSEKDDKNCFVQDNFYFLCEVETEVISQCLDLYESEEGFSLEYVEPEAAKKKNRSASEDSFNPVMREREARVIEMLMAEGLLD